MKTGGELFVCDDKVGEMNVFAITDETVYTAGREELKVGKEIEEVAKMDFQRRVKLEPSMVFKFRGVRWVFDWRFRGSVSRRECGHAPRCLLH